MLSCMRYLGIDYGTKKIGLALSDESGTMAFPHSVLKNEDSFFKTLVELIERENIGTVVIGYSHNKDGSDNVVQKAINELVTDLTLEVGIPVHLESEIFSTKEAERIQGKGEMIDASAAAIILNSFFLRNKK